MATTSIAHTARNALVTAIDTGELSGNVYYSYPGPLGDKNEVCWVDGIIDWTHQIPNIKSGRVQRQEELTFVVVVIASKPEEDSQGASATFQRLLALIAEIEDAIANDVQVGSTALQWTAIDEIEYTEEPYDKGWVSRAVLQIQVHARLT